MQRIFLISLMISFLLACATKKESTREVKIQESRQLTEAEIRRIDGKLMIPIDSLKKK